ncbi:MAG: polar amino acid transport system substrate-binding protein [Actinomycetota bacterium]|jgi:polar amino acid transport system substrate-binding protein|nr:polar amino acid transport system substrate-binding protein [Actinomycetota bacterium]
MRRFAAIGMAITIVAGLSACSSSSKPASSNATPTSAPATLAAQCGSTPKPVAAANFKPVKAGTLSVVTSLPGPGFWEGSDSDPTKVTAGYEYDIAKCMQSMFGLSKFNVRNVSFDAIVAGTVQNYDLALSQVSITPARAKVVSFSTSYFESQQGILMKADKSIGTLAEAKKLNWGVQTATTAVDLLKNIGVTNPHSYVNLTDAYTALEAGQVDAVLIDTAINLGEAARSKGKFHVVAQFNQPGGPDHYGAILPKGSTNVAPVDAVFNAMNTSGQLKALTTKDLTADPGTIPVIQVPTS